jgi:hypothetical protein
LGPGQRSHHTPAQPAESPETQELNWASLRAVSPSCQLVEEIRLLEGLDATKG